MPQTHVSLIHGARRLYRLHPNRQWMGHLRDYLLNHGAAYVSCFNWSGGILQGFRGTDAAGYATNLMEDYRRAVSEGARLSIVSKSLGGLIAEKALALLRDDIHVHVFLRVGVPDVRTTLRLPDVVRVVNVTSRKDYISELGKRVVPYLADADPVGGETSTENVQLRSVTHYSLTEYTLLHNETVQDATTYDLYWRLLNS